MNRIKELRRQNGINQTELSRLLNVSQATVSGYETGRFEPDNDTLIKIAKLFNVSTDEVIGYDNRLNKPLEPSDISDVEFALVGEIRDMSEDEQQDVLDYVRFKRAQKLKQK